METCRVCGKNFDPHSPHFILLFNKEATDNGAKKTLHSEEAALICEECGGEGPSSVLHNLKIIHDIDTELTEKMQKIRKAVKMSDLMKEHGMAGEKVGTGRQYLTACPFHGQEASFLFDDDNEDYFCFCEGLKGDAFSFVVNYYRDVKKQHITLKQAVDILMERL